MGAKVIYDSERMAKVRLDTADPKAPEFQGYLEERHIQTTILEEDGPAGGNAYIKYIGTWRDLACMVMDWWGEAEFVPDIEKMD